MLLCAKFSEIKKIFEGGILAEEWIHKARFRLLIYKFLFFSLLSCVWWGGGISPIHDFACEGARALFHKFSLGKGLIDTCTRARKVTHTSHLKSAAVGKAKLKIDFQL